MGGKKKKTHRQRGGVMGRSGIPLVKRMQAQRLGELGLIREQSARIVGYAWCVAFNRCKGTGILRLDRFLARFREVDREFYGLGDIETSMDRMVRRFAKMDMELSGELIVPPRKPGTTDQEYENQINVAQAGQIAVLCACVAANDTLKYGKDTFQACRLVVEELMQERITKGDKVLLEPLEEMGFLVIKGRAYIQRDETGKLVKNRAPKKKEEEHERK